MPANALFLVVAILIAASAPPPCAQVAEHVDPRYVVPPTVIPKTLAGILEKLRKDEGTVQATLDGTSTEGLYPPFTRVRDLAVALEGYVPRLPRDRRARAGVAVRETVRLAWLVHEAADFGQPGQTRMALELLRPAIAEIVAAFEVARR